MIEKKRGAIKKGKFRLLKASNTQQTRRTMSCVFQETNGGVTPAERGHQLLHVNKAELPPLFMLLMYSGPCVLASVVIRTVKALQPPNSRHFQECEVIVI